MLAASFLLMSSTSTGVSKPSQQDPSSLETLLLVRGGKLAQVYGVYLWANVALVAALAVILRRQQLESRAAATAEPTTQVVHVRATVWTGERREQPIPDAVASDGERAGPPALGAVAKPAASR
jgi:hypothetical protein